MPQEWYISKNFRGVLKYKKGIFEKFMDVLEIQKCRKTLIVVQYWFKNKIFFVSKSNDELTSKPSIMLFATLFQLFLLNRNGFYSFVLLPI